MGIVGDHWYEVIELNPNPPRSAKRCRGGLIAPRGISSHIMKKIGILGGGQLGRMLLQAAGNYVVETYVLENDPGCPAAHLCHHFTKGDITDFETVYQFGKQLDALTIEIESVNVDALEKLESEGVKIYPRPSSIRTIKNKVVQKEFYAANQIPTSEFIVTQTLADLAKHTAFLPAVHKIGEGGYDGKGVTILESTADISKGFDAPAVLEKKVKIKKEIAMIVAMSNSGETAIYPPAEMIFDPVWNLLDYQLSPAILPEKTLWKAEAIAVRVVKELKSPGLFAVELFVDMNDEVLVNETAPRVHNSGHHTIEANYSSQYDMLWRIMLDYPLGNTDPILPSAIVNILGANGHSGAANYEGLKEVLAMDNVFVHLYGKIQTKPGRKMGHVTIISKDYQDLTYKANKIKHLLKVTA
jgi:5-(carboxyamino)imidazole ribonucleotide synthase